MSFSIVKHKFLKKIEKKLLDRLTILNQKSNPKSKYYKRRFTLESELIHVEFYLMDTFEIYHYKPIYNALLKEKGFSPIFICEPCEKNIHGKWFDYEKAKKTLEKLNLNYKETVNPEAEIAISTQHIRTLSKYKKIKINLQYGTGFNKTNFCNSLLSITGYDYRFNYAKFTNKNLSKYIHKNRMFNIGLPKQDEYYIHRPPKQKFETDKPILLYYPTWDEDSSVQLFYDEFKKLKNKFFIITKAHHCTFRLENKKEELNKLYEISDIVLDGNSNFASSTTLGEIAIIDAKSGASTEVPYLNPDIKILYLSPRKNIKEYFHKDIFKYGYLINDPKDLLNLTYKIYKKDKFIKYRKNTTKFFMGNFDGKATERAINAIKTIVNNEYKIEMD